jgi:hypothetical protein
MVLDPFEAATIVNLLVGFYTARLPRGVAEASEELDVLKHIDGKLLSELIKDIAAIDKMIKEAAKAGMRMSGDGESRWGVYFIPFPYVDILRIKKVEAIEGTDIPLKEGLDTENASYAFTIRVVYDDGSESRFTAVSFCVSTTKTPIEIPNNDNAAPDPGSCIPHVVIYPSTPSVNLKKYRECMEKSSEGENEEEPEENEEDKDEGRGGG